jgi:RNA polymerase sigma-70 factor (ECF subfamily)
MGRRDEPDPPEGVPTDDDSLGESLTEHRKKLNKLNKWVENAEAPQGGNDHERALLERISQGDRDAFRDLYLRYHRRLARFLSRVTRGREDAEEVINDTLWIVWQRAGEFRNASRVSTWIMGIAYRRALKLIRRAATHARIVALDGGEPEAVAVDALELADRQQLLERALATLPVEQRLVLEFTYYLDHSCEEIAEIMECPVNTVKTRMFHARRKLRTILADDFPDGLGGGRDY